MRIFYSGLVLLALLSTCKKDGQATHVMALPENNMIQYHILGRQYIVSVPTGDYTYPVSQALLWLPQGYKRISQKKYPLIINLYGTGQMGSNLNLMLTSNTMSEYIAHGFNATAVNPIDHITYQYIVFSPQCPGSWGWSAPQVKTMLNILKDSLQIDTSRIYLTGFSSGGWGLWSCITDDESLCAEFAAISPISSAAADHPDKITNVDKYGIACWDICGNQDAFYVNAVSYVNIINSNDPPIPAVLQTLYGVGHSAWVQAYDSAWRPQGQNLYEWLLQYHK